MPEPEQVTLRFPCAGLDDSIGFERNIPRVGPDGSSYETAQEGANVRSYPPSSDRLQGGSRCGIAKFVPTLPGGNAWLVQGLSVLVAVAEDAVQYNQSGRVPFLLCVNEGNVYFWNPGDTDWTLATNNTSQTPPLNATGAVRATSLGQKQYFVDGTHYVLFDPSTSSVEDWTATAGTMPVDDDGNACRLITTWRGRINLAGLIGDPQNLFASAVSDATNWDYSPVSTSATQAFSLSSGNLGICGDVITCLVSYTDDTMILGLDHGIEILRGDPLAGGQRDQITTAIGFTWGEPYTIDPEGTVWFWSNRNAVYTMVPGQQPARRSKAIDSILRGVDTGANQVLMLWDDTQQGLHVFVTPVIGPVATTNYFYEARVGAWWKDVFGDANHNVTACCTFDGNNPGDRVALIGSYDGYVRSFDPTAGDDDGEPILSEVWVGPLLTKDMDAVMLHETQALLGETSGDVGFEIYTGSSAENALSSTPKFRGTWKKGRNPTNTTRRAAHAVYIRAYSRVQWAIENIRLRVESLGMVRRRERK